jgi:hypothetical protein
MEVDIILDLFPHTQSPEYQRRGQLAAENGILLVHNVFATNVATETTFDGGVRGGSPATSPTKTGVTPSHSYRFRGDESVLNILAEMGPSDRVSGCIAGAAIMTGLASLIISYMNKDGGEVSRETRRLKVLEALNDIVRKGDQETKEGMGLKPWDIISCTPYCGEGKPWLRATVQ